jgi:hypothetical protein
MGEWMKPDVRFINLGKEFWANIRCITQKVGYTKKGSNTVKIPTPGEIIVALQELTLNTSHIFNPDGSFTSLGQSIHEYLTYRANVLNSYVEPRLMDVAQASELFSHMKGQYNPTWNTPMNKQSGAMKNPAYFTGIINMIIEANLEGLGIDYNPRELTTITSNNEPLRTFSRWMDGAFPSTKNPIAIWEIKEYYYATTFGSRVADAVYETHLDGMEIEELRDHTTRNVKHYLFVDSHYTWWVKGRSYLCRIIDLLHMGYVDEVLFGNEVVNELPSIVKNWVQLDNAVRVTL